MQLYRILLLSFFVFFHPIFAHAVEIHFVPFKIDEIRDPVTGQTYASNDHLKIEIEGKLYFEGLAGTLLELLNETEAFLNRQGDSLRREGIAVIDLLHTDPQLLKAAFLRDLGLSVGFLLDKVRPAIENCQFIEIRHLGINIKTSAVFNEIDILSIEGEESISAAAFIDRINHQQGILCSIGRSLFEKAGDVEQLLKDPTNALRSILEARINTLDELGISKFHSSFAIIPLPRVKAFAEIAEDVMKMIEAKGKPGPERVADLMRKVSAELPEKYKIPPIPNIPAPNPPIRKHLALKKRKDWRGLNEGDRSTIAAYANAFYEVRGSELRHEATAEAKKGVFIFGNEINTLYGFAQLYAGEDKLESKFIFQWIGDKTQKKSFSEQKLSHQENYSFAEAYFEQSYSREFFVGPVPIVVRVGTKASIGLNYHYTLAVTSASGGVHPYARAEGFAEGAIGIRNFLEVGAGGSLTIFDVRPSLNGQAALKIDTNLNPRLELSLNSNVIFEILSGRMYAFAKYPVPSFNWPPYRTKKSEFDIFRWEGMGSTHNIMNWNISLSDFGVRLGGDILDQIDREETQHLQEGVDLYKREMQLKDFEEQVIAQERAFLSELHQDLDSQQSHSLEREKTFLDGLGSDVPRMLEELQGSVYEILSR